MPQFAYTDSGATATTMLWQHVKALVAAKHGRPEWSAGDPMRISVLEESYSFGPGAAYGNGNLPCLLVNTESQTLTIDPDKRDDFVE